MDAGRELTRGSRVRLTEACCDLFKPGLIGYASTICGSQCYVKISNHTGWWFPIRILELLPDAHGEINIIEDLNDINKGKMPDECI